MEKIKNDERVKPSFFRRMQTSYKKEEIYVLEDNDKGGEETKDQDEINKIVTKFYTELWKNRRGSRDFSERKLDKLIKKITNKITEESKERSSRELTVEEIKEATKSLMTEKSPGIDGIPAEFYKEFEYVTEWLHEILVTAGNEGELTETMRTSVVKILFKKGDRKNIGNYRPISLACTDYKIFAKVITERIKPTLPQIIGSEQQGFIEGGDITGNLILVKEIIDYCKEENIEAYLILMDFKKAYDRIDRKTIETTMRAMNYGEKIIGMIKLLYAESEAVVITNDKKEKTSEQREG